MRQALYIGNELYPGGGSNPSATIATLQASPLTSPILSLLNWSAANKTQLVYNDAPNAVFDTSGNYIGDSSWPGILATLRGGNIVEAYLSFSTNGTAFMGQLIGSNPSAAKSILSFIKNNLGFDGIDIDDESGNFSPGSPLYALTDAAIAVGLKLTSAPFTSQSNWQAWVAHVQKQGGTVAWLNLQCYAGGKFNNPGDWLNMGSPAVPIVAGTCSNCCCPQTTCAPSDVQSLYTLWVSGQGSVSSACWQGSPNSQRQAIGGGFFWTHGSISSNFTAYMTAMQTGLSS
jgi:hypothetical protein